LPCREVNPPFWTNPDSVFFHSPRVHSALKSQRSNPVSATLW
jgi:hypothetical protein